MLSGVQVAIYADKDPGGKKFIATLKRRLKNEEIRAWQIQKLAPFTLIHAGDRYTKIKVTFVPAGTPSFSRAAKAGLLGAFKNPEPTLLATISDGPSADRVAHDLQHRHVAGVARVLLQEREQLFAAALPGSGGQ